MSGLDTDQTSQQSMPEGVKEASYYKMTRANAKNNLLQKKDLVIPRTEWR